MSRPAPAEDVLQSAERRRACRALVLAPLLTAEGKYGEEFLLVRRHREELERLFADGLGYRLVVEAKTARLFKAGLGHDPSRALRKRLARGSGRPFDPRAYTMFCLAVAALTRCPGQLLVEELVTAVKSAVADTAVIVDLDGVPDRRALSAALLALLDLGVLAERDGDLAQWADAPSGEVTSLLDVRRDRLRLLMSAGLAQADSPQDLLSTQALPSAAGGARVALRRRLLEQPLLSITDLSEDQADWWSKNRRREAGWFREKFGLELELRAEGAVAIDPDEELSDIAFPGTGSTRHAALLVLERIVADVRADASGRDLANRVRVAVSEEQVSAAIDNVMREHGRGLRKAYADVALLRVDVLETLAAMSLLVRAESGFRLHAAAARYAAETSYAETLFA